MQHPSPAANPQTVHLSICISSTQIFNGVKNTNPQLKRQPSEEESKPRISYFSFLMESVLLLKMPLHYLLLKTWIAFEKLGWQGWLENKEDKWASRTEVSHSWPKLFRWKTYMAPCVLSCSLSSILLFLPSVPGYTTGIVFLMQVRCQRVTSNTLQDRLVCLVDHYYTHSHTSKSLSFVNSHTSIFHVRPA